MLDFTANIDNEASGGTKGATGIFGDLAGTSYAYIETEDGVVKVAQSVPVAGGGTETWAQTLASGNTSGGNDPTISSGDKLDFASSCVIDHIAAGNIKIGPNALASTVSFANIGIGENALQNTTTSGGLIGIGFGAGSVVTNTEGHTFVGESCNAARNTSVNCTVVGGDAKAGSDSVSVGRFAGSSIFSGTRNTLVGYQAGDTIVDTSHNTIVGYRADTNLSTNGDSTAVGALSVAGNQSVAVGEGAQAPNDSSVVVGQDSITQATRQLILGQGLTPDATASRFQIEPTTASVVGTQNVRFDNVTGYIGPVVSSAAYKTNIRDTMTDSKEIYKLRVVDYQSKRCSCFAPRPVMKRIEDDKDGHRHYEHVMKTVRKRKVIINKKGEEEEVIIEREKPDYFISETHHIDCKYGYIGLIAEEVEEVLPQFVEHDGVDETPNAVDYQGINMLMLKELQNHENRIRELERKISEYQLHDEMIKKLERKIKILEIDMPTL